MIYVKLGKRFVSLTKILQDAKQGLEASGFARLEYPDGILEIVSTDETGMLGMPMYDKLVHLRLTRYTGQRVTKARLSIPRYLI